MEGEQLTSGKAVARATGIVSAATLLSRILGMLRDMLVASHFGAGLASDAFFAAFKVPNLLRRLVAEGSLSGAFVPLFTDELARSKESAQRALSAVNAFAILLTSIITAVAVIYAEPITNALAPGFGVGSEKSALSVKLLQIMLPYTVLVSMLALSSSVLNCLGKFALPALWPVVFNATIILCVLFGATFLNPPIYVLAWSILIAGATSLMPQLFLLARLGFPFRLSSPFGNSVVGRLIRLMIPSILSGSLYQLMIFLNTLLASLLAEGSVTWLYYADRLFQFPLGVFTVAIGTAILPSLSRLSSENNNSAISRQLTQALCWMTVITVPATVGLITLATPIVSLIYERGQFSAADTAQTARCLVGFSIGLWSVSCQSILVRAYLAKKQVIVPSLITCCSMIFNVFCAFLLMGPAVGVIDTSLARLCADLSDSLHIANLGHAGLALAGSFGSFGALIALGGLLPRISISLDWWALGRCLSHSIASSVPMSLCLLALVHSVRSNAIVVIGGIPLAILLFLACARAIKLQEASQVWDFVVGRLRRKL